LTVTALSATFMAMSDALDLTPSVVADLVSRLEDVAHLLWFEMPVATETEHRLALELGSSRCLEAAAALAILAARARPPEIAA
jgi:hypothetical protein